MVLIIHLQNFAAFWKESKYVSVSNWYFNQIVLDWDFNHHAKWLPWRFNLMIFRKRGLHPFKYFIRYKLLKMFWKLYGCFLYYFCNILYVLVELTFKRIPFLFSSMNQFSIIPGFQPNNVIELSRAVQRLHFLLQRASFPYWRDV